MIDLSNIKKIYISTEMLDMRKSINGITGIVENLFKQDPFSGALFIFTNKNKNRIKILHYELNGFWLYFKRLDEDKFKWPKAIDNPLITTEQLKYLLDGLDINPKGKFTKKNYKYA